MTAIRHCPVCHETSFAPYLEVKDYTVSQETFTIVQCVNCTFKITSPIPDDIGKYYESPEYISHSGSSTTLTDKLYHFARSVTLRWKTNLINHYNQSLGKSLLDYGCGTGAFLAHAKKNAWTINGVEPAATPRATATRQTQTTIAASLDEVPDIKANIITLWHVLEHVPDLHAQLEKLTRILTADGTIFIAVPNHTSYDARHYDKHWAAYDTPRHLWHFSRTTMEQLLQQHHLKIKEVLPMKLDAFYVSLLSEKYKSNGAENIGHLIKGFATGLRSNLNALRTKEYSSLIYIAGK